MISSSKQALDAAILEMGRMVAECAFEREEVTEPDPDLQKWSHEKGSLCIRDQKKIKVKRPAATRGARGRALQSYARARPWAF